MDAGLFQQPGLIDAGQGGQAQRRLAGAAGHMGDDLPVRADSQCGATIADLQRVATGEQLPIAHTGRLTDGVILFHLEHLPEYHQVLEAAGGRVAHPGVRVIHDHAAQRTLPRLTRIHRRLTTGGRLRMNIRSGLALKPHAVSLNHNAPLGAGRSRFTGHAGDGLLPGDQSSPVSQ